MHGASGGDGAWGGTGGGRVGGGVGGRGGDGDVAVPRDGLDGRLQLEGLLLSEAGWYWLVARLVFVGTSLVLVGTGWC